VGGVGGRGVRVVLLSLVLQRSADPITGTDKRTAQHGTAQHSTAQSTAHRSGGGQGGLDGVDGGLVVVLWWSGSDFGGGGSANHPCRQSTQPLICQHPNCSFHS